MSSSNNSTTATTREYVPVASMLTVLPFVAAVQGFLERRHPTAKFRITIHRVMQADAEPYLQQLCDYLGKGGEGGMGRIFPATTGIIGAAFTKKSIWRTKQYTDEIKFMEDLRQSMKDSNDQRDPEKVPRSYLAIPFNFVGEGTAKGSVVLILYADSNEMNSFGDSEQTTIIAMAEGFCTLLDSLVTPSAVVAGLRNFPFPPIPSLNSNPHTVYQLIQEEDTATDVPSFKKLQWFNFEAT